MPVIGEPMPKLRHTKVVFAAVLSGVMAAFLVCLLCWSQGWNPAWAAALKPQAGAPIGEASVSEPPAISTNAAKNSVTANSATGQAAGQSGISGANAAVSVPPADAAGLAPDLAPDLAADQGLPDQEADKAVDQVAPQTAAEAQQGGSKVAPPATPSAPAAQAAGTSDSKVQLFGKATNLPIIDLSQQGVGYLQRPEDPIPIPFQAPRLNADKIQEIAETLTGFNGIDGNVSTTLDGEKT